jgi:signal transduction histidine kinase
VDITEQIDAGLLAALPIPVAVFDRAARLIAFSPTYAVFSGLTSDFLNTRPSWSDLIARLHAGHRLPEVANLAAWRDEERHRLASLTRRVEERQYLPDGATYKRTASPLKGGGFVLAYEDMTPRIAAERAVNEAALVQRQTLDHLADALAVFGSDGRLKLANTAFRALWTWDGDRLSDFLAASGSAWDVPHLFARRAGSARIERGGILLEAHHLPLPDGAVLLRYADVTIGARLQDALRARAETTEAADRMKSEFVATLAHEARVPLTTIAGFAEMLAGGYAGALTGRQIDYANGIAATTTQLARLIDDILDLAGIEAGMTELEPSPFDLHTALAGLVAAVSDRVRTRRLTLAFDCPPGIGRIDGDERRIRQAVLHLLNNAILYTPAGGTITLSAKRTRTHVEICIDDTGIGIARDELTRVDKAFVRGAGADALGPGAGLGLTLVRRFVEMHGGDIKISSQRNRGTTVTIHLPFVLAPILAVEKPDADR